MFWFLWFHDLLLPSLIFRIVFGLLRRRLSTYPTLKELQERRQETARALKFGEAVRQRLSVTTLGPIEMWHLFKLYRSEEKSKAKPVLKDASKSLNGLPRTRQLHLFAQSKLARKKTSNVKCCML